jgi:hypothetical protein
VDGTKRIDETVIYAHAAENHRREIPAAVSAAPAAEADPDRKVLAMLAARGSQVVADQGPETKKAAKAAL